MQIVVCIVGIWNMLYHVSRLWFVVGMYGVLFRRLSRTGVTDLEFDGMSYWRYALEAIMYDDIFYVFMNKDSPWTLSMVCINKYVTYLWDYALYDECPKRSLVERVVWTRNRLY